MYKILLDDKFYQNTFQQNEYLKKLLELIKKYFDAKIVFFEPFNKPIKTYHLAQAGQMIHQQILNTRKVEKYDLTLVEPANNDLLESIGFNKLFIGKIEYIINSNPENIVIIPMIYSRNNRKLYIKNCKNRIYFIGNYDEEVKSNISEWIINNKLIHILEPNFYNKFPANELCDGYNKWRSEILQPKYNGDKISDLTEIGFEVAIRNKYIYDAHLTVLNKRKAKKDKNGNSPKRQVFKNIKKDVYLSTDFENGGFEVYDKNAHHKGQYKFNGDFEKDADEDSHPLFLK